MRLDIYDNQQALGFMIQQTTYIEAEVYKIQYPDIIYPQLVPVDSSAQEWAKSVTYFSVDKVGEADWYDGMANDMRYADVNRNKFEQTIEMAAIGYRYTLEELGQAMMIPGLNLSTERAEAAVRNYEEFMDRVARLGDANKGFSGLINNPNVTRTNAIADGTGSSALWSTKTADQIIRDVQNTLTAVYQGSNTVEMADTHAVLRGGSFARFLVFGRFQLGEPPGLAREAQRCSRRLGEQARERAFALLGILQQRLGAGARGRLGDAYHRAVNN